ncbi:MAG TPA: GAF domain-containing protein [Anaeromyxobacteraceae bacterium]|nr:GAF domain-containing protein [Anaeromyxobacteraceae bacterium]
MKGEPFDLLPVPCYVVREGRIVRVNRAFGELLEVVPGDVVGEPCERFVPSESARWLAERNRSRVLGEPVPAVYETAARTASGRVVPVEVRVALQGEEVHGILVDLSERATHRERMEILAEAGARIQEERSRGSILATIEDSFVKAGLACSRLEREGSDFLYRRFVGPPATDALREAGLTEGAIPRLSHPLIEKTSQEHVFYLDDVPAAVEVFLGAERGALGRRLVREAGMEHAVLVRITDPGGPETIHVAFGSWLSESDLPAFRLLAAQVTAALGAAHTIAEISAREVELAARNRLVEIAAAAPTPAEFFERAGAVVAENVGAHGFAIFLHDAERDDLVLAYATGVHPPELLRAYARRPVDSLVMGAVIRRGESQIQRLEGMPEPAHRLFSRTPYRTFANVPLRVRSRTVGLMSAAFNADAPVVEARLPLLEGISEFFASAAEAQRLLDDLRRRVSELELLNDTALAFSATDPHAVLTGTLPRVFEAVGADVAVAYLLDGDELVQQLILGVSEATRDALPARFRILPGPLREAIQTCRPVLVPDMASSSERARLLRRLEGVHNGVVVPLTLHGRPVGLFIAARRRSEPLGEREVRLLSAVGAQLGAAVENARLLADSRRQIAGLAAVNEVAMLAFETARGDFRPLLATAGTKVARALGASSAAVMLLDERGTGLRPGASWGSPAPPSDDAVAIPLERSPLAEEVIRMQRPAQTENAREDPRTGMAGVPTVPDFSLLVVPVSSRSAPRGILAVAGERGRHFTESEVALAFAMGTTLATGLENTYLQEETRRRADELSLVNELGRHIAGSLDVGEVLRQGAEATLRLVDGSQCVILLVDRDRKEIYVAGYAGDPGPLANLRLPFDAGTIGAESIRRREPLQWSNDDPGEAGGVPDGRTMGIRSALAAPLIRGRDVLGAVVVFEKRRRRIFTPAEVGRVVTIANPLAVAVENARLFEDLRKSYADLARTQKLLVLRERLAALGELSAVVAHEVRNPLAAIFNSLGSLQRMLRPEGDAKLLLEVIQEEADRLNRTVGDLLDFARPAEPDLRPESLERIVEDTLAVALSRDAAGIVVERDYSGLPAVPVDARHVRQAVLNLVMNAIQAMPRGGRLAVRSRVDGAFARIEIADTGPGIPAEKRPMIFQPFFTTKATGTGLGLAVVRRIAEGHGGTVEVVDAPSGGATFVLRFPLAGLADVETPSSLG